MSKSKMKAMVRKSKGVYVEVIGQHDVYEIEVTKKAAYGLIDRAGSEQFDLERYDDDTGEIYFTRQGY